MSTGSVWSPQGDSPGVGDPPRPPRPGRALKPSGPSGVVTSRGPRPAIPSRDGLGLPLLVSHERSYRVEERKGMGGRGSMDVDGSVFSTLLLRTRQCLEVSPPFFHPDFHSPYRAPRPL